MLESSTLAVATESLASLSAVHAPSASFADVHAKLLSFAAVIAESAIVRETQLLSASSASVMVASCISLAVIVFDATLSAVIELLFTVKLPASISMNVSSTLADMVLPLLLKPDPAKISPALLN
jgi:hypothetical protein